jgi:SH3-like domain-containing protein
MTSGFLAFGMCSLNRSVKTTDRCGVATEAPIQPSLTVLAHTVRLAPEKPRNPFFSYQMAVTTQSFRAALLSLVGMLATATVAVLAPSAYAAGDIPTGSVSGLPIPRFVSLKSDRVNVRGGPNKDQDVRWVYTRVGMPVEITAEYENWRRIRDWEGAEGWVYHTLLSGKRSAVVVPPLKAELVPLYESADVEAPVVARLQPGVLGSLKYCNGTWCQFNGKGFSGFIRQERLWGAYPNEKVE